MIDDSMLLRIRKKNALQGRSSEVDHTHDACRVTKRSIYITSLGFYEDAMRDPLVWAAVFFPRISASEGSQHWHKFERCWVRHAWYYATIMHLEKQVVCNQKCVACDPGVQCYQRIGEVRLGRKSLGCAHGT
jgi:hypothetical protein